MGCMPGLCTGGEWLRLHHELMSYLRKRGASEPEELAQETVVRVLVNAHLGVEIRSLEAYTFRTAKNVFREHRRRGLRERPLPEDLPFEAPDDGFEVLSRQFSSRKGQVLSDEEI